LFYFKLQFYVLHVITFSGTSFLNVQAEQKRSSDEILNHELSSTVSHKQAELQESEGDDLYENLPETHLEIDERHQSHTLQQAERTKELQVYGVMENKLCFFERLYI
jgi:uncharacterized membrane protein YgaE (UPF0421/DUF939 family)